MEKKKFYKRWWFILIVVILVIGGIGATMDDDASTSNNKQSETKQEQEKAKKISPENRIKKIIEKRIKKEYADTDIDKIEINEDVGTDVEGDYIALVHLVWNVQNSGKTSKEMLAMYSEDLAATVAKKCENVQEIAIFWEVPYLDANAKCAYERKNGNMYEMDMMWDKIFLEN